MNITAKESHDGAIEINFSDDGNHLISIVEWPDLEEFIPELLDVLARCYNLLDMKEEIDKMGDLLVPVFEPSDFKIKKTKREIKIE